MAGIERMSGSDWSESSDEDFELFYSTFESKRPKKVTYLEQVLPTYNDEEFIQHFRVSREVAEYIQEQFAQSQYFHHQVGCNGKLSPMESVLIFLWFIGHQTDSFRDLAKKFSITISTLFRIIRRMSYFVSNLAEEIIKWPDGNEITEIEQHFRHSDFPGVIGIIDGTQVRIGKPQNDPDSYLNSKHFYSIQLQAVCDHNMKFRDLFVGFPGSVPDSRIFRRSPLCESLPEKCQDFYLLGDNGYPCLGNLLTPFQDFGIFSKEEREFNVRLTRNHYLIRHCFGLLKQKFRQLNYVKLRNIKDIVHLIRACCVLHNLAIDDQFHSESDEDNVEELLLSPAELEDDDYEDIDETGIARRNLVAFHVL